MQPTPEQLRIIEAGRESPDSSLMIQAMAGTGKTTTLVMLASAMPLRPSLALVFNKRNKEEMEKKFPSHFEVKTLNGLGHNAWGKAIGKRCGVEPDKLLKLTKEFFKKERLEGGVDDFTTVLALVRRARVVGLIPETFRQNKGLLPDTMDSWELIGDSIYTDVTDGLVWAARTILTQSIKLAFQGTIDYDDQIYMSALFGGVFPRFPVVMTDESQDLSPLNHIMVRRASAGRLIVVGDPRQAIYAFRGADSTSMDTMRQLRPQWIDLTLSTTWRCPKVVVARQQDHAKGFTAADAAPEGTFHDLRTNKWTIADIERVAGDSRIAILCRNNAPLLKCALRIIKSRRGVTVLGGELGKSLVALARRIIPKSTTNDKADGFTYPSIEDTIHAINLWADEEISKARANEKEERVAIIQDKRDCLLAVAEDPECKSAADLIRLIETIFDGNSIRITLSTGHKAKGLEWPTVVHLDPFRIPSKFARAQLDSGNDVPWIQDMNLRYVIETRTQRNLILANLDLME